MPIYEYRCGDCGKQVEVLIRSSNAIPRCPNCGSHLTDKLFSVPNVLSAHRRQPAGHTCCGQDGRRDTPPCSEGGPCCHD